MRIESDAPIIVGRVRIGGKTSPMRMDMILDTGATYTIIPWKVAERLGYDPARVRKRVKITTASSVEKAPVMTPGYIEALGKKATSVEAICHDMPPRRRTDGLLGLSFLRKFETVINFKKGFVRVNNP